MKTILILILSAAVFFGCSNNKEAQLQSEIQKLQQQNTSLTRDNESLRQEVRKLQETDEHYYQCGADAFAKGEYKQAIDWLNQMKNRFPSSSLLPAADKLSRDAKGELATLFEYEQRQLDNLIREANEADIEEAITKLQNYVTENHPAELVQKASLKLEKFRQEYEIVRTERESERFTGIKLTSITSKWDWRGDIGNRLLVPQLQLKFKNISNAPIERLCIKADFINVSTNEVFGEALAHVVGYGDTPLQPGYTKTAYLYSGVGYTNDIVALSFPNLVADIYVNDKLYRKIKVSKSYGGIDWNR